MSKEKQFIDREEANNIIINDMAALNKKWKRDGIAPKDALIFSIGSLLGGVMWSTSKKEDPLIILAQAISHGISMYKQCEEGDKGDKNE